MSDKTGWINIYYGPPKHDPPGQRGEFYAAGSYVHDSREEAENATYQDGKHWNNVRHVATIQIRWTENPAP